MSKNTKATNPRCKGDKCKKGGKKIKKTRQGVNTKISCFICGEIKRPCKCMLGKKEK